MSGNQCIGQTSQGRLLKYYGVDRGDPVSETNYAILEQHAVKTIIVDFDVDSPDTWQNAVDLADSHGFDVVIWPSDWGGYDSNWPDCGWETPYLKYPGPEGDRIENVKPLLDAIGGHPRVIGIVNAHEPGWSCIMTADEMADIRTQLKDYVMDKFGRDIQVWNYIDNVTGPEAPTLSAEDIGRVMDVAVTWQHCIGGAEGSCSYAREVIANDRAAIDNAGLDGVVDLVFLFQTFEMAGYGYEMPTADQMLEESCNFLETQALDGFMFYTWGACWYTSDLWCPSPEHPNQHLWPVMNTIYDTCVLSGG
jgi:hypothetical protein